MVEIKEKTLESFYENGIERRSWTVYPIANVTIKKCDKSFLMEIVQAYLKRMFVTFFVLIIHLEKKELLLYLMKRNIEDI